MFKAFFTLIFDTFYPPTSECLGHNKAISIDFRHLTPKIDLHTPRSVTQSLKKIKKALKNSKGRINNRF
jgi:hypothetical protein